jgi:S1-C subfamily serine protease
MTTMRTTRRRWTPWSRRARRGAARHRALYTLCGRGARPPLRLWGLTLACSRGCARACAPRRPAQVFCTHTEPNFSLPWQRRRQFASTSSGFLVPGRRVLTNAHSVEFATCVSLMRRGDDAKYAARVLAVGTECDIALLTVDDEAFWADAAPPLQLGALPRLQDAVAVVGYPVGGCARARHAGGRAPGGAGMHTRADALPPRSLAFPARDTLSVTSGVVSRIEVTNYVHGMTELLGVQIDAAINSGNSGGPVLNEAGECVGIAFQSLKDGDTENIGFVIPTPVIAHFLADFARNGTFTGFPAVGFEWQPLEAPALRASLGMGPRHKGVLVTRVEPTAPGGEALRRGDVLMSFNGALISCDGTVPFRAGERIAFGHLVAQCFVGETARLGLLRDGQPLDVSVPLGVPTVLIPPFFAGSEPPYLIVAGLVFVPVCEPYLRAEFGEDYEYDTPVRLLDKLFNAQAKSAGEQVVVLSQVLAAEVNVGYEDMTNLQVLAFNGQRVESLAGLAAAVASCAERFFRFDLDSGETVVLDAARARAATPAILATHCIPAAASAALLPRPPRA